MFVKLWYGVLTTHCQQHKILEAFPLLHLSICIFRRIFLAQPLTQLQLEQTERFMLLIHTYITTYYALKVKIYLVSKEERINRKHSYTYQWIKYSHNPITHKRREKEYGQNTRASCKT